MAKVLFLLLLFPWPLAQALGQADDPVYRHIWSDISIQQANLSLIERDSRGNWFAMDILTQSDLKKAVSRTRDRDSLIIPIFPTVYSPGQFYNRDVFYFNYVLKESGMKPGDKVLVMGSGSGADVWAAWLKTKAPVYAVDINPLAVENTRTVARMAGLKVHVIQGDVRKMTFPKDFSNFDYVIWNMPFVTEAPSKRYEMYDFHDFDTGEILDRFIAVVPGLLKKGGKAIILNSKLAMDRISYPDKTIIECKIEGAHKAKRLYLCILRY